MNSPEVRETMTARARAEAQAIEDALKAWPGEPVGVYRVAIAPQVFSSGTESPAPERTDQVEFIVASTSAEENVRVLREPDGGLVVLRIMTVNSAQGTQWICGCLASDAMPPLEYAWAVDVPPGTQVSRYETVVAPFKAPAIRYTETCPGRP